MKRTVTLLFALLALTCLSSLASAQSPALPDLVPYYFSDPAVTMRLGGPTIEFGILTSNIGGQDFVRPRDPQNPSQWLLRQIYRWQLYKQQGEEWVLVDDRYKNTICTIDDSRWGGLFPCIREHGARFFCGGSPGSQGVSRGWSDDYFRGLSGQWAFLGDNTGRMALVAILDSSQDLQRTDLPDASRDGNPGNNYAYGVFHWDGTTFTPEQAIYFFDPNAVCPASRPERSSKAGWGGKTTYLAPADIDKDPIASQLIGSRSNSN